MKCACGCGQDFTPSRATLWRLRTGRISHAFIQGHNGRGANNGHWKGGRTLSAQGYWMVSAPDHPNARKSGYILEHRLIMSQHLRRPLEPSELVHHINGDKLDNRLANLRITKRPEHASEHGAGRRNPSCRVPRLSVHCLNCGTQFLVKPATPARPQQKYCSKDCQYAHMRGEYAARRRY